MTISRLILRPFLSDLYSRAVVGWSIQSTMSRQLVCDALMMALWRGGFPRGVLFHSDRVRNIVLMIIKKYLNHLD